MFLGKFLGSFFGYMVAGPLGAVMGLILGHYFDLAIRSSKLIFPSQKEDPRTQAVFLRSTFTIMGYIAKLDGRVSENEIRMATHIMQTMTLTSHLRQEAINYFQQGKQAQFDLDQMLNALRNAYHEQRNLLRLFLKIQFQVAHADGAITGSKQQILTYLCLRLGFNPRDYQHEYAHRPNTNYSTGGYNAGYNRYSGTRNRGGARKQHQPTLLDKAYQILGVSATASDSEIKKAYRKLISSNHPDRRIAKGSSESAIRQATQKTQEIKSAYETIRKARGKQ
jgi:DnaJ like chaperone protein